MRPLPGGPRRLRARIAVIGVGAALLLPVGPANVSGSGFFAPFEALPVGSWPEAVAIGDVTGDGRNDVVMTTSYDFDPANDFRLWIFAQTADGGLAAPVSYATTATYTDRATSVAIGDITGDGRADVLLGLAGLGIQVFPQDSSGLLGSPTLTATPESDRIRLGHLDGDVDLDVAGIGWGSNTISVFLNDGSGGLGASTAFPARHAGYDDLEVADVSGDGRDDLVVMSGQGSSVPNISVLTQLAGGGFGLAAEYRVGPNINTSGIGVGDVNSDGFNDIVASHGGNRPNSSIAVFSGLYTGTLGAAVNYTSYDVPEPVEVADIDLDGHADVVTAHGGWNQVGVYRGLADGTLAAEQLSPIPYASHYNPHGLAVGDINSDGRPDVVLADYNNGLVVLRNSPPPPAMIPGAPILGPLVGGVGKVTLSWSAPVSDGGAPIDHYMVYRGTVSGGESLLISLGGQSTGLIDASAAPGTTYYYQVSAVNTVGEGPRSVERSGAPASVPGPPTLTSATAGNASVALAWAAPAGIGGSPITGYVATASPGGAKCSTTGLGCTINGMTNGVGYSFTVRASNLVGAGAPSNALSATPQAPGVPPSAPRNPVTSPNLPEGILVSWTAPSTAGTAPISGYRIYRGTTSGGEATYATIGNVLSFTDTAVANGGSYVYQVSAISIAGEGPRSIETSAQRGTAPSAPVNLTAATNKPNGVALKWNAPASNGGSAITGYRIYRATSSGAEIYLVSTPGTATTYADKTTAKGVRYYYWVTAITVLGTSGPSNEANVIAK